MYDLQHEWAMLKETAVKKQQLNDLQSWHVYVRKTNKQKTATHIHISQTHDFLIPYLLSVLLVQLHLEDQDLPVEIIREEEGQNNWNKRATSAVPLVIITLFVHL